MGLPLRMNNLYAPTVPSGPTSAPVVNDREGRLTFAQLQQKKDNLEAELRTLSGVLDSVSLHFISRGSACAADEPFKHGVDMNTSLLTRDGFPRADIDVAQSTRTSIRV